MHRDFKELLSAFNEGHVKYLVVGGYAVSMHAEPRATKDLDILAGADAENSKAVYAALAKFGAPVEGLTAKDFTDLDSLFRMGTPPVMVDIMPRISGIEFEDAWKRRVNIPIDENLKAPFISLEIRRRIGAVGQLRPVTVSNELPGSYHSYPLLGLRKWETSAIQKWERFHRLKSGNRITHNRSFPHLGKVDGSTSSDWNHGADSFSAAADQRRLSGPDREWRALGQVRGSTQSRRSSGHSHALLCRNRLPDYGATIYGADSRFRLYNARTSAFPIVIFLASRI
jgi:hypothetical protein